MKCLQGSILLDLLKTKEPDCQQNYIEMMEDQRKAYLIATYDFEVHYGFLDKHFSFLYLLLVVSKQQYLYNSRILIPPLSPAIPFLKLS